VLFRSVDAIDAKSIAPSGWKERIKGLVNKGEVKQDEVDWSGLTDWLDMQEGKVTKEAVAEFLKNNGVRVERVQLGKDVSRINYASPYAIPEIHAALDRLSGHKLYCTFDFTSWFHQFEIAEEDRDKVAFVVPGDNLTTPQIYRYKRVAFGLMNATYFCQRQLQEALELWPGCEGIFPFVDDIVIATDSLDEMLAKLDSFMRFCQHYNIRLKKEKTELATTAVRHVGLKLQFDLRSIGQIADAKGGPHRQTGRMEIGLIQTVEGAPVGHVLHHHRRLEHVLQPQPVTTQYGLRIGHDLTHLWLKAVHQPPLPIQTDHGRQIQDAADLNGLGKG
jgi:hypothetical protein